MKEIVSINMLVTRGEDWEEEVAIDGFVHYHVDTDYGADADGNRGSSVTFVDDVLDVYAYDEDGGEVMLDKQDIELAKDNLAQKFLEG